MKADNNKKETISGAMRRKYFSKAGGVKVAKPFRYE